MRLLPIEMPAAFIDGVDDDGESREWSPVPCQWCGAVRTFHKTAVCRRCRHTDEAA